MANITRKIIITSEFRTITKGTADVNRLTTAHGRLNVQAARTVSTFGTVRSGLTRLRIVYFNLAVTIGVTVYAIKKLIEPILKLETEMVNVRKRTKMTVDQIEELRKEFIELSRITPESADELAKLGAVAGQLGIRGAKNILEFTRVANMMGNATVLTSEEAALALGKLSKAFNLPISEVEKLGSAINELSNTTAANSKEIVAAMLRMAPAAHQLGITAEMTVGISASLIALGMRAERAGCYDEETEVLTDEGWKYFKDLNKKERIMTLNPNTERLEWQKPTKYVEQDWTGKHLIQFKGKHVDLEVTPDHRMWVKLRSIRKDNKFEIKSAIDIKDKRRFNFQRTGEWTGKKFEGIGKAINNSNNNLILEDEKSLFRFFGHFLSEGCLHKHDSTHFSIDICQKPDTLMSDFMYGNISKLVRAEKYKNVISVFSRQLYTYLKDKGFEGCKANTKFIPKEWKELGKDLLTELLNGLIDGDGNKKRQNVVWTTSKKLADDIQEICLKIGWGANVSTKPYSRLANFWGKEYYCKGTLYSVYITKNKETLFWNERGWGQTSVKKHIGKVYCAVVPNGVMMVRRKGKAVLCGNTRMRTAFTRMATQTKALADLFNEVNGNVDETANTIKQRIEEDANKAFLDIVYTLTKIESGTERVAKATKIFGRVGATAINGLAASYLDLQENIIRASDEFQKATSLQNEYNIALQTTANQWTIMWGNIRASITDSLSDQNEWWGSFFANINQANADLKLFNSLLELTGMKRAEEYAPGSILAMAAAERGQIQLPEETLKKMEKLREAGLLFPVGGTISGELPSVVYWEKIIDTLDEMLEKENDIVVIRTKLIELLQEEAKILPEEEALKWIEDIAKAEETRGKAREKGIDAETEALQEEIRLKKDLASLDISEEQQQIILTRARERSNEALGIGTSELAFYTQAFEDWKQKLSDTIALNNALTDGERERIGVQIETRELLEKLDKFQGELNLSQEEYLKLQKLITESLQGRISAEQKLGEVMTGVAKKVGLTEYLRGRIIVKGLQAELTKGQIIERAEPVTVHGLRTREQEIERLEGLAEKYPAKKEELLQRIKDIQEEIKEATKLTQEFIRDEMEDTKDSSIEALNETQGEVQELNEEMEETPDVIEDIETAFESLSKISLETLIGQTRDLAAEAERLQKSRFAQDLIQLEMARITAPKELVEAKAWLKIRLAEIRLEREELKYENMDDFIMRPNQPAIAFNPKDTIIGIKDPEKIGGSTIGTLNINVNGGSFNERTLALEIKRNIAALA